MKKISEVAKAGLSSALGTKALLVFTVLVISSLLQQAVSVSSALGSGQDWIIEGDCVYWNNTKGDVRVCPHTLQGSGWAYFNVTSYSPASFNLDFAFGITENIVPSKPQIWANISHPVFVSNCTVTQVSIVNNGTPGTENRTTCSPYYAQNFYPDWESVGGFSTVQYDGKIWYLRTATWNANETKSGRVWLDVRRMSGKSKYSVFLKKASDSFAQAEANGNYVLLDPWTDSPPTVFNETFDTGAFLNGTWGNLNISRGWLILNMTGTNATVVTRNASDDGVARTCRNSSQDAGSLGSLTSYACSNNFDGVISTGGSPANAWSGNTFTEPEWIIKDLPAALWMYNFSIYTEYVSSTWGAGNFSFQCSDTAINTLSSATATLGGSDSVGNWNYATFNVTNLALPATSQYVTLGQVRCRSFRFNYLNLWNPATNAMWLAEIEGQQATFNSSGQKLSILLNGTITVDKVNVTCVNTTGVETGVGMNITVMDKNYANEQTVQCNSDSAKGFENDISNIEGLIYRVNFSSKHSGITPELDFLTLRVKEASGSSFATEAQGDVAIELGINSSLPSATKYSSQQAYMRNLSNNHTLGRFDWVAASGSQRWLINYITTGESYVSAPNLTTAVYMLEITDKTSAQITDEVSRLINATKS